MRSRYSLLSLQLTLYDRLRSWSNQLERRWLQNQVGGIGARSMIYEGTVICGSPQNIIIGDDMVIWHQCFLTVGENSQIYLAGAGLLGVRCYLNAAEGKIIIGRGVAVAPLTQIYSFSHGYASDKAVIDTFQIADVVIEDDVLIGSAVTILPGVRIGQGAIVAAGAVVRNEVAPYSIVGGIPARLIGWRHREKSVDIE